MKEASYRYNDELVGIIRDLVKKYYRNGWISGEEIDAYAKGLYNVRHFEKIILNPSGEFQGTASALEVPGEVGGALETTICNMVETIAARDPKFDFKKWKKQWERSVKTGD